ncbi:unnamed protein product [Arabidopsis halleri]
MTGSVISTDSFICRRSAVNIVILFLDSDQWDNLLPTRLFATNRYPRGRLNVYSKPDTLCFIRKQMKGSPEFERLLNSCFGSLFALPVSQCPISCKLIHALICRQLITKKKYEIWTVFGGQPMRFSLAEFGEVTGLPCGEFPDSYDPHSEPEPEEGVLSYWDELIGEEKLTTLDDIRVRLSTPGLVKGDDRLRLALILIVDGVLLAKQQYHRPSFKYVLMLEDIDSFLQFPWGRESFFRTIMFMKPAPRVLGKPADPIKAFAQQFKQQTIRLQGFPLALQLLAYRNINGMADALSDPSDHRNFVTWSSSKIPKQSTALTVIHAVEQ